MSGIGEILKVRGSSLEERAETRKAAEIKEEKILTPKKARKPSFTGKWIENTLEERLAFEMKPRGGTFSVSSMGDGDRMLFLKYRGEFSDHIKLKNARYMTNGTKGHDRWEESLKRARLLVSAEQNLDTTSLGIPLRGRYDFLIRNPIDNRNDLIELKTMGHEKWKALTLPHESHIAQWSIYAERIGITHGYVVIEDRDSLTPKYFPLRRDGMDVYVYSTRGGLKEERKDYISNLYNRIKFVMWCDENGKFPKDQCPDCIQWGCKQDGCVQYSNTLDLVTFEDWKAGEIRDTSD